MRDLRELGVTAVELMPVGQFPGTRNWGYDGVLPYAAQDSYGGPHGLQRLVDACHAEGLAIFLDVVYNHFGPEGNYLSEFGPYFTDRYKTPWGAAVNYRRRRLRRGPRLRARQRADVARRNSTSTACGSTPSDAIFDLGARHILRAIKEAADAVGRRRGWPALVVAESDLNDPRLLYPVERGGYGLDAQWIDDFHHAAHAFLTGERHGYYADFGEAASWPRRSRSPTCTTGSTAHSAIASTGPRPRDSPATASWSSCKTTTRSATAPAATGSTRFAIARRSGGLAPAFCCCRLLAAPVHGRGIRRGEPVPVLLLVFRPGAGRGGARGPAKEFDALGGRPRSPTRAEADLRSARLTWSWPEGTSRAGLRRLYRDLLAARREWPALRDFEHRTARLLSEADNSFILDLVRGEAGAGSVRALFNFDERPHPLPAGAPGRGILFSSEATKYGGSRADASALDELLPFECVVFGPPGCPSLDRADLNSTPELSA